MNKKNIFLKLTAIIEHYLFPVIFFFFSLKHLFTLYINLTKISQRLSAQNISELTRFVFLSDVLIMIALIIFNTLTAYALLITANLKEEPEGFLEVFIPFIATFWFLTYNIIPYLPPEINVLIIPKHFLAISISIGSILALSGLTVASIAIFHLRKSFSVFVEVRDIVTKGLYRYVRHPIYFGHLMAHVGFFFITPRLYAFFLSTLLVLLTLYRARLEERKLAKYSPDYRQYIANTPFIIPYKIKN